MTCLQHLCPKKGHNNRKVTHIFCICMLTRGTAITVKHLQDRKSYFMVKFRLRNEAHVHKNCKHKTRTIYSMKPFIIWELILQRLCEDAFLKNTRKVNKNTKKVTNKNLLRFIIPYFSTKLHILIIWISLTSISRTYTCLFIQSIAKESSFHNGIRWITTRVIRSIIIAECRPTYPSFVRLVLRWFCIALFQPKRAVAHRPRPCKELYY